MTMILRNIIFFPALRRRHSRLSTFCQRKKICQIAQNRERVRTQQKNNAFASRRMICGQEDKQGGGYKIKGYRHKRTFMLNPKIFIQTHTKHSLATGIGIGATKICKDFPTHKTPEKFA